MKSRVPVSSPRCALQARYAATRGVQLNKTRGATIRERRAVVVLDLDFDALLRARLIGRGSARKRAPPTIYHIFASVTRSCHSIDAVRCNNANIVYPYTDLCHLARTLNITMNDGGAPVTAALLLTPFLCAITRTL